MKFAHISDLHLGKRVNGFSMIEDQRHILGEVIKALARNEIEALLIAGDIYDKTQPSAEAVALFDDFLCGVNTLGLKTFIVSGNHDSAQRIAFGANLFLKSDVYVSPVFDGKVMKIPVKDEYGCMNIYLLPYIRPSSVRAAYGVEVYDFEAALREVVLRIDLDKRQRNLIVAHQFITGAKLSDSEEMNVGGMENISAEVFQNFDYVALGHIHGAQDIVKGKIRYCGTPLKYSFSEATHKKSITVIDMRQKGEVPKIEQIPLKPLRDLREIKGTYQTITSNAKDMGKNDYIHVILTDEKEIPDAGRKLMLYYPNIMKLSYDNSRTRRRRIISPCDDKKTEKELFIDFYKSVTNSELNGKQQKYIEKIFNELKGGLE